MSLPRLPELDEDFEIQDKEEEKKIQKKKEKPRMPKSEYDSDGNPILTVPDLNDINLQGEIEKYFGEEVDNK